MPINREFVGEGAKWDGTEEEPGTWYRFTMRAVHAASSVDLITKMSMLVGSAINVEFPEDFTLRMEHGEATEVRLIINGKYPPSDLK